jgi:RNA polymerase sigma-70 factor (ECF subfamily)
VWNQVMLALVRKDEAGSRREPDELDALTLARAQRGDEAAFRMLVARYEKRVHRIVWRMLDPVGRGAAVDDLCQETFVRVFRALPRFTAGGSARLSTWILTIATRLALNELRNAKGRVIDAGDPGVDQIAAVERADAGLERRDTARIVRAALASLDPDHRAVLLLREVDELDYEEIARVLDVNVGTVRSRLHRARARLREALGEVDV